MARQQTSFDPAAKEFEAYLDFSGGQNSDVSNERLNDNEFPLMLNVDNSGRGSARTRSGRVDMPSPKNQGLASGGQGLFNYYRDGIAEPDLIMAADGQLFRWVRGEGAVVKVPIVDDANPDFRFQTTKPIEAAQYQGNLFIATGTKLVELTFANGNFSAKTVTPYAPTAMEVLYIGTNGLAANPDEYIQDGVASGQVVEAVGIKPQRRTGAVNVDITMTAFVNKPAGYAGTVDYKWAYKKASETTWPTTDGPNFKNWSSANKTVTFKFDTPTKYDVRVTVRKTGDTTTANEREYTLSNFTVNPTADPASLDVAGIQRCRKIILHWDRLLLSGDDVRPYQMYISDLQNPRYFPVPNTINFDFGKQEPITAVVRFQDMLVVFTRSTIQTLLGKSTDDYKRYMIHDGLGCISGRSAVVVGNNVLFLSQDGVYALKPNPYRIETLNVARVDQQIQREIDTSATNACAIVHDSQYWLCFPDKKEIYRYYYDRKVWVKDFSENLNIGQFLQSADDVFNMTTDARMFRQDRDVYLDAGAVYDMEVVSKFLDLSASFNNKSLKRIYILARHYQMYDVDMYVTVKADSSIVLSPDSGKIVDGPNGWYWQTTTSPNFEFLRGTTFGAWIIGESPFGDTELSVQRATIRGKCRRVRVSFKIPSTTPSEIYGFALQFKLKKI